MVLLHIFRFYSISDAYHRKIYSLFTFLLGSTQHESVLMRVYSAVESSESQGGHGELVVMAPNMVCTETKLCRLSKNTQQQATACFLPFSNSDSNSPERRILFPSFQELGNLAISPNHVPHFLFLQETFSF